MAMISRFRRLHSILTRYKILSINTLYYIFKRNFWLIDLKFYSTKTNDELIDKPIFLVGTQGSGLTLVSRVLRRSKYVVSATGNYKYWSGADETNNVFGTYLPRELKSFSHYKPLPSDVKLGRDWMCGMNKYKKMFVANESHYNQNIEVKIKKIVTYALRKSSNLEKSRYIDKSQNYSLKVPLLAKIFRSNSPIFIYIIRNPYAICMKVALGGYFSKNSFKENFSFEQKLKFACQTWKNYYMYAVEKSGQEVSVFRFEDCLNDPEETFEKIFNTAKIKFNKDCLPKKDDKIPFGSMRISRWYPLKPKVNEKYYRLLSEEYANIIEKECGDIALKYNYKNPYKNTNLREMD